MAADSKSLNALVHCDPETLAEHLDALARSLRSGMAIVEAGDQRVEVPFNGSIKVQLAAYTKPSRNRAALQINLSWHLPQDEEPLQIDRNGATARSAAAILLPSPHSADNGVQSPAASTPVSAPEPPAAVLPEGEIEGYCARCGVSREIKDPALVTLKNGRPAARGECNVCGTAIVRNLRG